MQLDLYILYFFVYSLIGYCCEVVYCSFPVKRLVNRGFLYGPYLPIYGFGAMIVLFFFQRFIEYPLVIFFAGLVSTSLLEFFTSWLLEKFFHAKLWDYSKHFLNIKGRVCLLNSTLFGIMSVVVIYVFHPLTVGFIEMIPIWMRENLSKAILIGMCIDTTASIYKMAAFQKQMLEIRKKGKELEIRLELLQKERTSQAFELLKNKLTGEFDEMKLKFNTSSRHIIDAFPSITSSNEETKLQIELLKMNLRDYRTKMALQKSKLKQKAKDLAFDHKKRNVQ
ncbi:putative membrane protein [Sphaerochaeta pleomorpha str. Grapes]|uniref:Putative membrane protein n=1 Tax=Sphaerochaeta pleomorpha (strain ATCC BAA-1885 / DSM 22778 / Grapes) TaxID=158190 RepID=G8QVF3_SPHPG|nr:hypothetical protein [Sphaerochaeta pleomorpha]AEV28186.1 putative membrane protein [Sphaerochaeta pleomorpha str. Grapes]